MKLLFMIRYSMLALALIGWSTASGQQVVSVEQTEQAEQVEAETPPPPEPSSSLAPGEEVMKPTAHGIRMTRKMAEGIGKMLVREELDPSDTIGKEQKEQLARNLTERMWDLKMRYGQQGSVAVEHMYEMLMHQELPGGKKLNADEAREFSEKVGPGPAIIREFWEGMLEDARPVLNPEQFARVEEKAQEILKMTRRFEERMDRWSRGEIKENEGIFDGMDEDDLNETGKPQEYVRAERTARWRVNSLGPEDWRRFLDQSVRVFGLDEMQKQSGEKLLADYSAKAKEIMSAEWKAKALANRVQEQLQWQCPKEPLEPWVFRLESEYKAMTKPVQDMGRTFRREVLAMVRPDQRERLLEELRKVGSGHGMTADEVDVASFFPPFAEVAVDAPTTASDQGQ